MTARPPATYGACDPRVLSGAVDIGDPVPGTGDPAHPTPTPTVEQATRDAIAQVQSVRLQLHQLAQIALTAADALAVLATAQEDQL